jgi:hypothetical protein
MFLRNLSQIRKARPRDLGRGRWPGSRKKLPRFLFARPQSFELRDCGFLRDCACADFLAEAPFVGVFEARFRPWLELEVIFGIGSAKAKRHVMVKLIVPIIENALACCYILFVVPRVCGSMALRLADGCVCEGWRGQQEGCGER